MCSACATDLQQNCCICSACAADLHRFAVFAAPVQQNYCICSACAADLHRFPVFAAQAQQIGELSPEGPEGSEVASKPRRRRAQIYFMQCLCIKFSSICDACASNLPAFAVPVPSVANLQHLQRLCTELSTFATPVHHICSICNVCAAKLLYLQRVCSKSNICSAGAAD